MNQIRLRSPYDDIFSSRRVIAKVNGKVRIRTYRFQARLMRGRIGYTLLIIERGHAVVERGFTWSNEEAAAWLEERTGGISVD